MAIDYTTLFTQIGRIGRIAYVVAGGQAGVPAAYTSLFAQYADHEYTGILESQADSFTRRAGAGSVMGPLVTLARQTLLDAVATDAPSQGRTVELALAELVRQMTADGKSVADCTVSVTPAALTGNTGDGALVTSTKRGDGLIQQNAVAEEARLVCTRDSYASGATAGLETFRFLGADPGRAATWDYDWPGGSGADGSFTAISPGVDASGSNNRLTNSDFEDWTSSAADNWLLSSGAWGTDAVQSATAHGGTYSVNVPATKTPTIYQAFDSSTGTTATLAPLTSYAVNLWLRRVSAALTTGTLVVELTDSGGTVVADEAGTNNTFSIDLTTLTTSWAAFNGVFRVPAVPPATLRLRLRVSVAGDNDFLIDDVAMGGLFAPYRASPGYAVFAGATPWAIGDGWDATVANNRAGASYGATFQTLFDRLFGTAAAGVIVPYSGTETQADTLITAA